MDKLFQPFFTTEPTGEGAGFGLSISYEIVTAHHGGAITVDSRLGGFTKFTVRPAAALGRRARDRSENGCGIKDCQPPHSRRRTRMSPRCFASGFWREAKEGAYNLHFAHSGAEALDRLAAEIQPEPIVILSDINMPGMDGLALLREIKTRRPELVVMMVDRLWRRRTAAARRRMGHLRIPRRSISTPPNSSCASCRAILDVRGQDSAVDDEPDFEQLIRQRAFAARSGLGGEYGISVRRATGAEALCSIAARSRIEQLALRHQTVARDGRLTLLARLSSDLRAVIVSAYGDMSNIRIAMNRGAFDFVTKPIDLADLEADDPQDAGRDRALAPKFAASATRRSACATTWRYFSPNVVELLAGQDEPPGPVRRQDVAVLFADIVGFTALAETMTPEAVMETLRVFHGRMSREVFACGGTLEKYIGDAILATRAAPSDRDAGNMRRAAGSMLAALDRWNDERRSAGAAEIRGIGVNYGPVSLLGDLGGEHGMAFTVIGDTVNASSRLQDFDALVLDTPLVAGDALVQAVATHEGCGDAAPAPAPPGSANLRPRRCDQGMDAGRRGRGTRSKPLPCRGGRPRSGNHDGAPFPLRRKVARSRNFERRDISAARNWRVGRLEPLFGR